MSVRQVITKGFANLVLSGIFASKCDESDVRFKTTKNSFTKFFFFFSLLDFLKVLLLWCKKYSHGCRNLSGSVSVMNLYVSSIMKLIFWSNLLHCALVIPRWKRHVFRCSFRLCSLNWKIPQMKWLWVKTALKGAERALSCIRCLIGKNWLPYFCMAHNSDQFARLRRHPCNNVLPGENN